MGTRDVRVVVIRKGVTFALLILTSAAMASLLYFLSGKAYANDSHALSGMYRDFVGHTGNPPPRDAVLAALMPMIANALLFVPWGFLTFVAIDSPKRRRLQTYVVTVFAGLLFAVLMEVWQTFLPTRVTGSLDVIANGLGAFAGAVGAHLRKQVRVQFDH